MTPLLIRQAKEEIIPRHDEDSAFFQDFIQLARGLFCSIQPEPKEESAFAFVQGVGHIGREKLRDRSQSGVPFSKIKGANDLAAEANDFATGNERTSYRLAEVSIREAGHGHHGGNRGRHLGRTHHKCGACAGQTEFGEAHHMHGLAGPERLHLAENNPGEWPPVGVVDDERNVTLRGDVRQMLEFGIRDQIPAGIRRP